MTKLDLIKKEKTVYGYDILQAVSGAFRLAKDQGKPGDEFDIMETILMELMDDDIYKIMHITAQKNHEKAMEVAEALDIITGSLKELFK